MFVQSYVRLHSMQSSLVVRRAAERGHAWMRIVGQPPQAVCVSYPIPKGYQRLAGGKRSATTGKFELRVRTSRRDDSRHERRSAGTLFLGCHPSGMGIPFTRHTGGGAALTTG